ncbi:hypothetical protein J2Z60_000387 [Lactobacillus colini]|uniref:EF-hand domain-containing protein n=1 Tax=Lactobacillus colini TaxID=1819254 RepID=A0ABS4MC86_9LACO|nr:hypothetical protein [Lactobacillus colini]MBP2057223.1 hypothetical protein [Lactobacillus colini]
MMKKKKDIVSKLKNSKRRGTLPRDPHVRMAIVFLVREKFNLKSINELSPTDFYYTIARNLSIDVCEYLERELKTISLTSLTEFQSEKFYKFLDVNGYGNFSERDFIQALCIIYALRHINFSFKEDNWNEKVVLSINETLSTMKFDNVDQIFKEKYPYAKRIDIFRFPLNKVIQIVRLEVYRAIIRKLLLLK